MVKKRHTNKELIISTPSRWIGYVSRIYAGQVHDYNLLQAEFEPQQNWFESFEIRLDLGFQGFADLYPCQKLYIPHKKKRVAKGQRNGLTPEQKAENKAQAKHRIRVEHSIGGIAIHDTGASNAYQKTGYYRSSHRCLCWFVEFYLGNYLIFKLHKV